MTLEERVEEKERKRIRKTDLVQEQREQERETDVAKSSGRG